MATAARVRIREFRRNLKHYLEQSEPLVVTKGNARVAVVLPLGLDRWAGSSEERAALARIKKMMWDQVEPAVLGWQW